MQQTPDFTLTHVTGRRVSLSDYRGRPVVIVFGGRGSGGQMRRIIPAIRARYLWDDLPLLVVIDLHAVPGFLRPIATVILRRGFQQTARKELAKLRAQAKPAPDDLALLVTQLPDWQGRVAASFGFGDSEKLAAAVLVDGAGRVAGSGRGELGGEELLALIERELGAPTGEE
jgi:AhpC/TSA family